MNVSYVYGAIVYVVLASFFMACLPPEVGAPAHASLTTAQVSDWVNDSAGSGYNLVQEVSFFRRLLNVVAPWTIAGVPEVVGVIILLVNVLVASIPIIYFVDLARGRP